MVLPPLLSERAVDCTVGQWMVGWLDMVCWCLWIIHFVFITCHVRKFCFDTTLKANLYKLFMMMFLPTVRPKGFLMFSLLICWATIGSSEGGLISGMDKILTESKW